MRDVATLFKLFLQYDTNYSLIHEFIGIWYLGC